jgi:hypothetical protein
MLLLRQEVHAFVMDLGVERRFGRESRQQLFHGSRIEQRPRKAVLSCFARFFEHVNVFFGELCLWMPRIVSVNQLRQSKRACHARRTAADDDYIGRHLGMYDVGERLAENQHSAQR